MLGKDGAGAFVSRLRELLRTVAAERWEKIAGDAVKPAMPPAMILRFIASAYMGVIVWWVEHDCRGSSAEVAAHLLTLTIQGPYWAFGLTPPE